MKQVVLVHGGDSFDTYEAYLESLRSWPVTLESFTHRGDWKRGLQKDLGGDYQVLAPEMPNRKNARYEEWRIWFERMFPFLDDEVLFVGHSQGGIFLAKYLSENKLPKKISALLLVAPPYNDTPEVGDFKFIKGLELLISQASAIHLFYSKDDKVVPFDACEFYQKELPNAKVHIFLDRGHFNQESLPELTSEIKAI